MEKPTIASRFPKFMEMEDGEYYWCACGKSSKQPFCDGSHRGSGIEPVAVKINEKKGVYWCMCKQTKNPPFCDGKHKEL